jgi:glycosyltransferase involved in cell wall biosynthesis
MSGLTRARPAPASRPRASEPTRILVVVNERALESNMLRRAHTFRELLAPDFELEVVSAPRQATLADARAAEVVYVIDPGKVGFPAALRGWAARRPVVVEVGDPQADLYRAQARGRRSVWTGAAIDTMVARYATAVVVRGGELADVLDLRVPWIEIPDGVDVEFFRPGVDGGLRKQLGIPADVLVVGLVGSLRRGRRPESTYGWDIVEALSLLRDAPVFGLIVGDGDGLAALRARAAELGVADRAVMPGYVPHRDIAPYVAAMDVCVSRQTNDAVGRSRTTAKLPEYLACDRFVLATDVGGAAQVLPEGMLLPYSGSDDPEHSPRLARRVRELVSRRSELRAGAGTRRIAVEHYSYPVLGRRLAAFLNEVAR